jgi:hypothetical protein
MLARAPAAVVVLALGLAAGPVLAQWQWIDGGGRKVYSDTAPPADVPEKNILKRPGQSSTIPPAGPQAPSATPPSDGAQATTPRAASNELELKKKKADEAAKAKQKADEDKAALARADNCQRARKSKAALDSGSRIASVNAKGEREFMDDSTRAAESRRLQQIVQDNCR